MPKVKFNLTNTHYAVITEGEEGAITFGDPVRIPGAVSLALNPEGGTEPFYADGVKYYVSTVNNGYTGDLEIALIPDSFRKDVLGETEDTESKVLVENANVEPKRFALLFEFDTDEKSVRHVMYNCLATRPSIESKTNEDKKTPATDKLSLDCAPLPNGLVKAKTQETTTESVYTGWYKKVWEPTAPSPATI